MDGRLRRVLLIAAQAALFALLGWFVWRAVSDSVRSTDFLHLRFAPGYLAASWAALLGYYAMYILGSTLVLRLLGAQATFPRVFKLHFSTNLGKYVPGGIWPVVGRLTLGPRLGLDRHFIAPGVVLEAGLSVAGGLLVFFASLAFGGSLPAGTQPWHWALLAAAVLVGTAPPVFRRALAFGFRLAKVAEPVPALSYRATLGLTLFYALSWVVGGIAFRLYTLALVDDAPGHLLLFIGINAAASVTGLIVLFAPAGLGVREGVFTLLLTPVLGVGLATLVGFSARVWSTLVELTASAVALLLRVKPACTVEDPAEGEAAP